MSKYVSSNESVFTVEKATNTTATVTGVKAGTAELTAIADNGVKKTVEVTVTEE